MIDTKVIVIVCTISFLSDAAFVDSIGKCSIKDEKCMKNSFQKAVNSIGDHGIPELGIPSIDPIVLKDVQVTILGVLDITLIEGKATGVKNCQFSKFTVDIEKGQGSQENICDLTIEGKYKVLSDNKLIKDFLGESSVHGEGNGKIDIEKIRIFFDFPFFVNKKSDGEIYMNADYGKIKCDYEVMGRIKFSADSLYLGDKESSKLIVDLLNDNWKFVMSSFGRVFIDKAMEIYSGFIGKFFDAVPAKHFITDDLTPYIKH